MTRLIAISGWGANERLWDPLTRILPTQVQDVSWFDALSEDALNIEPGARQVLMGWSLGALLALRLALQDGTCVAGLVLISGMARFTADGDYPGVEARALRAMQLQMRKDRPRVLADFASRCMSPENAPAATQAYLDQAATWQTSQLLAGLEVLGRHDLRDRLEEIRLPVLVVHGAEDAVVPLGSAKYLAEALPNARLHTLEGRGHGLPFTATATLGKLVRDFIDGQASDQ